MANAESLAWKDFVSTYIERINRLLSSTKQAGISADTQPNLAGKLDAFRTQWEKTFARFEYQANGELAYQTLLANFRTGIIPLLKKYAGESGNETHREWLTEIRELVPQRKPSVKPGLIKRGIINKQQSALKQLDQTLEEIQPANFDRPIFIVSAPRSGSTLLFETLSQFPDLWSPRQESHEIIEGIPELHPKAKNYASNRLTGEDASETIALTLRKRFTPFLEDREGQKYLDIAPEERPSGIRLLEKTPKNALRIPFIKKLFPDALFIYLYRDARENISSMIEGWRLRRFIAYKPLPGWPYREWCFLLAQGWESLKESSLAEIAAWQWKSANGCILNDLQELPRSDWCAVPYAHLLQEPGEAIEKISAFAGLTPDTRIEQIVTKPLPISSMTVSTPGVDKWKKNAEEIKKIMPSLEETIAQLEQLDRG